jgi:hypothetical protein
MLFVPERRRSRRAPGRNPRRTSTASEAIQHSAGVVELVDTQDLGSCAFGCEGSSPSFGTALNLLAPLVVQLPLRSAITRAAVTRSVGGFRFPAREFSATPTSLVPAPVMIA